jgi:acyl carrier protein
MNTQDSVNEIQSTVFRLLREALPWQFSRKVIQPQLLLQNDLGLDSMGKMAVAFRIEEEFGLDLSGHMSRMGEIQTVGDIVNFIRGVMVEDGGRKGPK